MLASLPVPIFGAFWSWLAGRPSALVLHHAAPRAAPRAARPAVSPAEAARFRTVMLPHLDAAYSFARFLCRDPVLAEDLVQDAFLRAFRGFATYRGGDARAWILAIVRNGFRAWLGERGREPSALGQALDDETTEAGWPIQADTPETWLLRNNDAEHIRGLVAALPESFREVLVLREFEGLSYKDIAEITATPIGTVMSRLSRARALFAAAWHGHRRAEEGGAP
ncbi:RNA polymerase sigma-70 factor (ECF subfamily) [Humitalea rosea]|uniref:RNA polymerase sigma factor n=1 Tax=Humitalea rosea TaxID=990373 RepID=A0A2W7IQG8_9PROT|nr:sigma-70 family RNA polymerase sigma factor [Humitalea rosea]PZW48417.1 RNA polymerase sigma-70 factor (ECF subfamily) [Humitalea rosea]